MDVVRPSAVPSLAFLPRKNQSRPPYMKGSNEWNASHEADGEISIRAGGATFTLQKFPLVSKSGYFRKRLPDSGVSEIPDFPGGARGFELTVKFCYAIDFEINAENIALLRCAAEFLEMTEEYATGNLVRRAEEYLREVILKSIQGSITVLHHSESDGLFEIAGRVKLVSRCVDAIARIASDDERYWLLPRKADNVGGDRGTFEDWWVEDLTVLRIDVFKRVIMAMKSRGFKHNALGTVLMLYAQKALRGLDIFGKGGKKLEAQEEHEKRVVLETIVGVLPKEKNTMSVSFLTLLLRAAVHLETTVACRLDLEKRIGLQLGQAVLDDLLIPSLYSFSGDTIYDVESVRRILVNFLDSNEADQAGGGMEAYDHAVSSPDDMERVGRLMECYLAEIASDRNLSVVKFVAFAEMIPEQAKTNEDGMYRAIDIYLKAHPSLNEAERKKVCGVIDCQRLSREACAHAAQNERLPVQMVVQVLFYEQQRLSDTAVNVPRSPLQPRGIGMSSPLRNAPPLDHELTRLRQENDNLKLELVKMKTQVRQSNKGGFAPSPEKPPLPKKSIMESVSKKLGKLNPFVHFESMKSPSIKARARPPKDRRHSVS